MGDTFSALSESPSSSAVFISYAREDAAAARSIAEALRGFGIEVWFDQNELRGGDSWDQKIRGQIRGCTLFLAVISGRTQERAEGYFRREWKLAAERTHDMAGGVPFIVPVVIDGTSESAALVPEEFMRVQWTRLPGGAPTPEFVAQVKRLLAPPASRAGAKARSAGAGSEAGFGDPALQRRTWAGWAVAGLASLGVVGWLVWRPAAPVAPVVAEAKVAPVAPDVPALPAISNKSIAVLPFANLSDEKDSAFFTDGMHEDILTNLALIGELRVVSRTSVMQYRTTTKPMKQIGTELGVAYLLEGSVRRVGNKVRVTGQLINARTDEHVWAKSYDRDLTDIFAIQAALAQEIAGALSAVISPATQRLLARRPTENPVAYDDFLKGRALRNRGNAGQRADLREQQALFQSAVRQDPAFAAAWGELATVHAQHVFWGMDGTPARLALADAAIAEAVRLAPDSPDVIRAVGTYAYYAHRDYARATARYEQVARLQPNDPTVFSSLGLIQRRQGRWAESLANLRRAIELDPGNVSYVRSLRDSLTRGRRWPEVRETQRRLIALLPDRAEERWWLADFEALRAGSWRPADDFMASLAPAERETPAAIFFRKRWAIYRGDAAEYRRLDVIQPWWPGVQEAHEDAIIASVMPFLAGDLATVRARVTPAHAELRARVALEPDNGNIWGYIAGFELLLGRPEEALRIAEKNIARMPLSRDALDGETPIAVRIWFYALIGDKDRAIAGIADALKRPGFINVWDLRFHPHYTKLRGDPRFEALLADPKNDAPLF